MNTLDHDLATMEEKPGADVVIWDGHCKFCLSQVQRLSRWDSDRLAYVSLHDPRVKELAPELSFEQLMEQLWVVSPRPDAGAVLQGGGADAIRYLSRQLPWLWPAMPLLHIPGLMPVWRWLYRQVAQRRYRIAGKNCDEGTCSLHQ
ncbi:MAG TPA: DUF393 domain-containing protein [Planctomycetaceae bacterium]|nr:DUF393 domain-containing protein [Planctomycetaceae bacterium]